jgi:hypothetical protein
MISSQSVIHCQSLHTGIVNDIFFCSVQTCDASLEIWGCCWSCFSRKLILVRPMHQHPSQIGCIVSYADSSQFTSWCPQSLNLNGLEMLFFFLNTCQCPHRNFIKTGNLWDGEWKIIALGSSLTQLHQFRSSFHLHALLHTLLIFEMGVPCLNAFWIGCFWVLKPTFPQISPGKHLKSATVSSFSLLGHACRFEIPSKWPTSAFPVISFKFPLQVVSIVCVRLTCSTCLWNLTLGVCFITWCRITMGTQKQGSLWSLCGTIASVAFQPQSSVKF